MRPSGFLSMRRAATWSMKPGCCMPRPGLIAGCALDVGRALDQMPKRGLARHRADRHAAHRRPDTTRDRAPVDGDCATGGRLRGAFPGWGCKTRACAALRSCLRAKIDEHDECPVETTAGACECHVHIYEDGYPPHRRHVPSRRMRRRMPTARSSRGLDCACGAGASHRLWSTTSLPARFAAAVARCARICIIAADTTDAELQRLHAAGVRGVRFMMIPNAGGPLPWESLEPIATRIAPLGWNINRNWTVANCRSTGC